MRHKMFGGIHPAARKESTRRKALARMEKEPEWVILPLDQGGGGTAKVLVRPGDRVLVGQPVAREEGDGVPIHASVSGRVAAVEDQPHPWGGQYPAVVLQNDGRSTLYDALPGPLALDTVTRAELIERVRESGIVDMGGSGQPMWNRLEGAVGRADTLIIDAMECEPYLSADHRLMLDKGRAVMQTVRALTRTLGPERAVMVISGDKLNAVEAMERRLAMQEKGRVELRTMAARYPLDSEKQIVQAVTGREVPPGGEPADVNCLVVNVATVYAIGQCLLKGLPLVRRAVTVSGGAVSRPRNLWVPIGTPFHDLLKACDGLKEPAAQTLMGGPLRGIPQGDLNAPVLKTTDALVCLAEWELPKPVPETVCIRCGKCVASCPMHLTPVLLYQAARKKDWNRLPALHPQDCIQCGCCTAVCPARIPLSLLVRTLQKHLPEGGESA